MAHSFVQAHDTEEQAFAHFADTQPDNVVLLIDTYDTARAAAKVAALAATGVKVKAVRIDSGDLATEARVVRAILDRAGHPEVRIFASGDLDEHRLASLLGDGAPIDGFGVGTKLDTSADAPYLNYAYKLQEYAGLPRRKRSPGKAHYPGRRQVFRRIDDDGRIIEDQVCRDNETAPGQPLLQLCMRDGRRLAEDSPLPELRRRAAAELAALPPAVAALAAAEQVPVSFSAALQALAGEVDRLAH
jgi:nicotinate phosphoribosyltransferase